jgi:hypothetical protein
MAKIQNAFDNIKNWVSPVDVIAMRKQLVRNDIHKLAVINQPVPQMFLPQFSCKDADRLDVTTDVLNGVSGATAVAGLRSGNPDAAAALESISAGTSFAGAVTTSGAIIIRLQHGDTLGAFGSFLNYVAGIGVSHAVVKSFSGTPMPSRSAKILADRYADTQKINPRGDCR